MILVLDLGNSRLKWAQVREGKWTPPQSLPYPDAGRDAPPPEWARLARPERVVAGSVAGLAAEQTVSEWVDSLWGLEPEWQHSSAERFGLCNAYRDPRRLGVDRWAALVSAHCDALAPACIVDCGTAITLDVLARDGHHLGGWIAPGRCMQRDMLLAGTAGLAPAEEPSRAASDFGESTPDAIEAGIRAGLLGFVREGLSRAERRCGEPVTCLITGGDAEWLRSELAACRHVPDLVLRGFARLAGVYSCGADA